MEKKSLLIPLAATLGIFLFSTGLSVGIFIQDFSSSMVIEDVVYAQGSLLMLDDFMKYPNPISSLRLISLVTSASSALCFL